MREMEVQPQTAPRERRRASRRRGLPLPSTTAAVVLPQTSAGVNAGSDGPTLAAEASLSGSIAVLVGPSGAGKTSLLRSIAGLMRPQRGYVTVAGTTVWDSGAASASLPPGAAADW